MTTDLHQLLTFSSAAGLIEAVCAIAGSFNLIADARQGLGSAGVLHAVEDHNDSVLFEWLMAMVSYQGIGDAVASSYMDAHGRIIASDISTTLGKPNSCGKLAGYWTYVGCRYHKGSQTCSEPEHFARCPLPGHDLRNGRLNQTAYSLFLFFRDVAQGDFVGWIDGCLKSASEAAGTGRAAELGGALLEPLGHVHGVSDKVLSMALADLLLAAGLDKPLWLEAGAGMIAIDSLVHNWLHRTGILAKLECDHPYGARCYAKDGCAAIVAAVAEHVDARTFNADYPKTFPRFVQRAIWWFCAQSGMNQCNGNRIDDLRPCTRTDCLLFQGCEKRVLHGQLAF